MAPPLPAQLVAAISSAARQSSDVIGADLLSITLVGSRTTGEASKDRNPPSDIDLVAIFSADVPQETAHRFRRMVLGNLEARDCLRIPVGLRVRSVDELQEFQQHMISWGYDLHQFAQTLNGLPIQLLLPLPLPVPDEFLLRNLLGQLWWTASLSPPSRIRAFMDGYVQSRALLELCHFTLLREGIFCGTTAERLEAIQQGAGPSLLRTDPEVLEYAAAIRTGARTGAQPAAILVRLRQIWEDWFTALLPVIASSVESLHVLPDWFPIASKNSERTGSYCYVLEEAFTSIFPGLGNALSQELSSNGVSCTRVFPTLAVLLCLESLSVQPDRDDQARRRIASAALSLLEPREASCSEESSTEALQCGFARLQMSRCRAASRDLRPHLEHLLPPAFLTMPEGRQACESL